MRASAGTDKTMLPDGFVETLGQIVGPANVRQDPASLDAYGADALKKGRRPDVVVLPASATEVAAVAELCSESATPLVPRGAGTGQTGGCVPIRGGVLLSLERMNRILEIDEESLFAVVEPHVRTGALQEAVERLGLFYPPDPASLGESVVGGNIAENAGGPRAFKYGVTSHYVLGLEAVLPDGAIIRTGSKAVKNVVGYDLTRLLVGSEGTLAIITQAVLRLIPLPPARATLRATFEEVSGAAAAVGELIKARVVPSALELVDADCLEAVAAYLGQALAPRGTGALLLVEVDGLPGGVAEEARRVEAVCRESGATEVLRAATDAERERLWQVRREISPSLKLISSFKLNNDVVVPRGCVPQLFEIVDEIRRTTGLRIACFGHAGDGNIHVNIFLDPEDAEAPARGESAVRGLLEGVVALNGSISGEHGIGLSKAPYLGLELSETEIGLMRRIKQVFDPKGILNPGKIFSP